ncbi:MAG: efflux RND transporter permease subunit, partial [Verrucomicrobiaceae bacterium]
FQGKILRLFLRRGILIVLILLGIVATGLFSAKHLKREFLPLTDAGLMSLFLRVPEGTRIEDTGRVFAEVHREIRAIIPASELEFVAENIGAPYSVNQAWVPTTAVGSYDGEILVQLKKGHQPTAGYMARVRSMLKEKFPTLQSFFRPADATSQTLASGSPTTFEVRFVGRDVPGNVKLAKELVERFKKVPGAVDVTLREVLGLPEFYLEIDRIKAAQLGITQQDAVSSLLTFLGSGGSVSSSFWSDPVNGSSYEVQILAPPAKIDSSEMLLQLPIRPSGGGEPVLLGVFAKLSERKNPASVSRSTLLPTYTVVGNIQDRDLGAVTTDLEKILEDLRKQLKPSNRIELAGQAALMRSAYSELLSGLVLS